MVLVRAHVLAHALVSSAAVYSQQTSKNVAASFALRCTVTQEVAMQTGATTIFDRARNMEPPPEVIEGCLERAPLWVALLHMGTCHAQFTRNRSCTRTGGMKCKWG